MPGPATRGHNMAIDENMLNEFIAECKEHLSTLEEDFLKIEKQGDKLEQDLIDKVFRATHSIKGAAGFMGFKNISDLSHVMETVLQKVRDRSSKPDSEMIDILLEGADLLNHMIEAPHDNEKVDISKVHDHLVEISERQEATAGSKKAAANNADIAERLSLVPQISEAGFEIDELTLERRPKEHSYLYILRFDLSELQDSGGPSPVALVRELLCTGDILESRISTAAESLKDNLSCFPLKYDILYSSILDRELVTIASRLPDDRIIEIDVANAAVKKNTTDKTEVSDIDESAQDTQTGPAETGADQQENSQQPQNPAIHDNKETVRINVDILDKLMTLAGELVLVRNQHLMAFSDMFNSTSRNITQRLDLVTSEIQETIMQTRMQPVGNIFGKLPRIVRDIAKRESKLIKIFVIGEDVELDKTILESLADPLTHIIRNCCDHGIELPEERSKRKKDPAGRIVVRAYHEGGQINIKITDDGRGIDIEKVKQKVLKNNLRTREELAQMTENELIRLIMLPGFSTADEVSDISGRGVGMDVVKNAIEKLGGSFDISSKTNRGTTILLRMPLTLAIIPCLIVKVAGFRYAIPQVNLEEVVCLYDDDAVSKIESDSNQEVFRLRDNLLPMVRLNEILERPQTFTETDKYQITEKYRTHSDDNEKPEKVDKQQTEIVTKERMLNFAVVKVGSNQFGLIIDKVIGTEEIVVQAVHPSLKTLNIYSGTTVMGDGQCAMILDINGIAHHAGIDFAATNARNAEEMEFEKEKQQEEETQTVLLFKYGPKEQFAIPLPLIKRIEKIFLKDIEQVGKREFITIDGISTQVVRLDNVFQISPCEEKEEMFLILPKHILKPFGILVSALADIEESPLTLNTESYLEDGLLGSAIIRDKMTLYPDIYRIIEKLEPEWFKERRDAHPLPTAKKRILLVEDATFFRQMVKSYLEADGYEVESAENGKHAMDIFTEKDFDLIVSDIEMPEMNGWDFIKAVRKQKKHNNIKAVALTALSSPEDKRKCFMAGYDEYHLKIDREGLLKMVASMLR